MPLVSANKADEPSLYVPPSPQINTTHRRVRCTRSSALTSTTVDLVIATPAYPNRSEIGSTWTDRAGTQPDAHSAPSSSQAGQILADTEAVSSPRGDPNPLSSDLDTVRLWHGEARFGTARQDMARQGGGHLLGLRELASAGSSEPCPYRRLPSLQRRARRERARNPSGQRSVAWTLCNVRCG